jgi:hypothetical protein
LGPDADYVADLETVLDLGADADDLTHNLVAAHLRGNDGAKVT